MKKRQRKSERHVLHYGSASFPLLMEFRAVKRLSISVHPDQRVTVVAPEEYAAEQVMPRIRRRAQWIVRQRTYFEQFQPKQPAKRFISGETFRFLGRQYRLKVQAANSDSVKLHGRYLHVNSTRLSSLEHNRCLVEKWYRERAQAIFSSRFEACRAAARRLRIPIPKFSVRRFEKRWGSCSNTGKIVVNVELIKAPLQCIDYVFFHEICHLKVRDHGPRFFRLLSQLMPDWKRRKERLELVHCT